VNSSRELFGFERLAALVEREGYRTASALVERTVEVARTFSGRAGQADDVTVMVLKAQP
jgi:serine phosphatase RsbU (regulator of sigma subunit)